MQFLAHLLRSDPNCPRLTVYNESTGARMDFSAQTLDNWVAKISNMLDEELELDAGDAIAIDLPVSWQAAVIALGAAARGVDFHFRSATATQDEDLDPTTCAAVFTEPDKFGAYADGGDIVLVTNDPFGRGVEEIGQELPVGAIDFGPTVRFFPDAYGSRTPALPDVYPTEQPAERALSTGWTTTDEFVRTVVEPLSAGGSAVIVAGLVAAERLDEIARNEKVTSRL
ncbi:TIGR03089 family protein [Corynebacterium massiliense]|uniref:TIGR03089 family protein n=1 Tax=Corynebacterium massiliense TaxID=441501 RepID=UPI002351F959|nr:TIGR03089 family protein [Corynebacterium massiliense]